MINLLSKTGLGRSGHDWSQSFGPIWHVSGPEMVFWRNDIMILHHFCRRSSKIKLFQLKTLIFDQKSRKYPNKFEKYSKIHGFPWIYTVEPCISGWRAPEVRWNFIKKIYYFYKIIGFIKIIYQFYKIICFIKRIYESL